MENSNNYSESSRVHHNEFFSEMQGFFIPWSSKATKSYFFSFSQYGDKFFNISSTPSTKGNIEI